MKGIYKKPFQNSNIIETLKLPLLKTAKLLLVVWIFHPFRKWMYALSPVTFLWVSLLIFLKWRAAWKALSRTAGWSLGRPSPPLQLYSPQAFSPGGPSLLLLPTCLPASPQAYLTVSSLFHSQNHLCCGGQIWSLPPSPAFFLIHPFFPVLLTWWVTFFQECYSYDLIFPLKKQLLLRCKYLGKHDGRMWRS